MQTIVRLCIVAAIVYGLMRYVEGHPELASRVASIITDITSMTGSAENRIRALAAETREGDIVLYSSDQCPYSVEAKAWLQTNGFLFRDCNLSVDRYCEAEFLSHGATGTPYLIVRGHHMKNGFDSNEFIKALSR